MLNVILDRVLAWGGLVRFSHSVFALPFAGIMLLVLHRQYAVSTAQFLLLLLCVVSARTAAMSFNRVVDAGIDAQNARTKSREIPSGRVSSREAWLLVAVASAAFIAAAFGLGWHCGVLAVPVLLLLFGYSFCKRFSSLCHVVLGVSLACAPGGVWYALTATWAWKPVPLMMTVIFWVAGFDILYACQDAGFDRTHHLRSIPSILGTRAAQTIAALMHVVSVCFLVVFGHGFELGLWFWCGVAFFALLIASQHLVIQRHGLAAIDQVFFVRNGLASVVLMCCVLLDTFA